MRPTKGDFRTLGFVELTKLREDWEDAETLADASDKKKRYCREWLKKAKLIEDDRSTLRRSPIASRNPFTWKTREGTDVESGIVRLETICVHIALAEEKDSPEGEPRHVHLKNALREV